MNRRVLLIDADLAFRDTLTTELARYQVVVMTEPDAERALALANADAPALIVIGIEESEKKAGFRIFEKCKKGALSKIPIILVTSTVPPDSFAKHRGLKNHADEYIDKRTMTTHELVGKIDGLIGLGDPIGEPQERTTSCRSRSRTRSRWRSPRATSCSTRSSATTRPRSSSTKPERSVPTTRCRWTRSSRPRPTRRSPRCSATRIPRRVHRARRPRSRLPPSRSRFPIRCPS